MSKRLYRNYFESVHYTLYWKIADEERLHLNDVRDSSYIAHRLLDKTKPGDVLWVINIHLGRLYLIGRIKVAFITDDIEKAQELVNTDKAWHEAPVYAIADRRDVEPLRQIDITERIQDLGYVNSEAPLERHPINPQQFRNLRELETDTALWLNELWYNHQDTDLTIADYVDDYLELTEDDRAYSEGRLIIRTQTERLRNRTLVKDAKERAKRNHGRLVCEVCGFDFFAVYGEDYIEAHHSKEVSSFMGETQTKVEDLHMLCANCHRMVHKRTPPYSIEELKNMMRLRSQS
jgi:5-methylcytosine-specific restriction endonuclease McrA